MCAATPQLQTVVAPPPLLRVCLNIPAIVTLEGLCSPLAARASYFSYRSPLAAIIEIDHHIVTNIILLIE